MRTIVGRIHNDCVVSDAKIIEQFQQFAHMPVVLNHAVAVFILAGNTAKLFFNVCAKVHAGAIPPGEERLTFLDLASDKIFGGCDCFIVNSFHALFCKVAGVLDFLFPDLAKAWVHRAIILVSCPGVQHSAGAKSLEERLTIFQHHITGIIFVFRLLFGVEVVEIAEELVEAVDRRQVLVAVALVVFAKLASGVALAFENSRHGHVSLLPAFLRARQADLGHA